MWKCTGSQTSCKAGPHFPIIAVQETVLVTTQNANFLGQDYKNKPFERFPFEQCFLSNLNFSFLLSNGGGIPLEKRKKTYSQFILQIKINFIFGTTESILDVA